MTIDTVWDYLNGALSFDGKQQVIILRLVSMIYNFQDFDLFSQNSLEDKQIEICLGIIEEHNLKEFITELVWNKLCKEIRSRYSPQFWSNFVPATDDNDGYERFSKAVVALNENVKGHLNYITFLDQLHYSTNKILTTTMYSPLDVYKNHLSSILLSQIPKDFESTVNSFYLLSFRAFTSCERRNNVYFGMQTDQTLLPAKLKFQFF